MADKEKTLIKKDIEKKESKLRRKTLDTYVKIYFELKHMGLTKPEIAVLMDQSIASLNQIVQEVMDTFTKEN